MMKPCSILIAFCTIASTAAFSQVKLPRLIRDSMILQREVPVKLWGWAAKNEKVSIRFNGRHATAKAGANGKWMITLPPMKAGGPYTMNITGSNTITLKEILIGDVWLCSGQSNMVHQMELHGVTYAKDIATANYPAIRQFWVENRSNMNGPRNDLFTGAWKSANPEDIKVFSAVAYFFARKTYEKYHIPIGIINASVGGTPIEAWTSEAGLAAFPSILATIQKNKDTAYVNGLNRRAFASRSKRPEPAIKDKGLTGPTPWYNPGYSPKNWHNIAIPGYWEDQGIKDLNGVVWYRKEIALPASMAGKPARVFLGRIIDADVLYINGQQVGNTTYMYPQRRFCT
jgi:sialate O-acetylesterase